MHQALVAALARNLSRLLAHSRIFDTSLTNVVLCADGLCTAWCPPMPLETDLQLIVAPGLTRCMPLDEACRRRSV